MIGFRNLTDKHISIYLDVRFCTGTDYRESPETILYSRIELEAAFRFDLKCLELESKTINCDNNKEVFNPKTFLKTAKQIA